MSKSANSTGHFPSSLKKGSIERSRQRPSKDLLLRDFHCTLERPVAHFFKRRCSTTNPCSIVRQTQERTYYASAEPGKLSGAHLYFVSTAELCRTFPTHQSVNSTVLSHLVKNYLSELCPAHHYRVLQSFPFVPFLQRDGIEINVDWQYKIDAEEPVRLSLCLFLGWHSSLIQRLY